MDALTLLREQAALAEKLMTDIFAPVTVDQATWRPETSTTNPIASIFLHVYTSEDGVIARSLSKSPIRERAVWSDRLGYDPAHAWTLTAPPDLASYRSYAAEVAAAAKDYLTNLEPGALEQEVDSPRGRRTRAAGLSLILTTHKLTHAGEIAALLGCQGVKGLPF